MSAVIEVRNLVKAFGDLLAVDDLSFTVYEGDVYGFLGQNGAGKSTTIRMLLSLIRPDSGNISLLGKSLLTERHAILRQVGAVIERPDLYKYLSAYENLSIFARMSGIKPVNRRLMDQLEQVGLAERAHSRVETYSQGMKQRLGIAVALIHDPRLVILDEPTNGLDPQGIADMRNLIMGLSRDLRKTVLVSSHLLSEIEQIATRMIIIDKGKKIVEGNVDELFHPGNNRVHLEVAEQEKAWQLLSESRWGKNLEREDNAQLALQMPPEDVPLLVQLLVKNEISILSVRKANTLEDYFLSLTAGKQHVAAFTN